LSFLFLVDLLHSFGLADVVTRRGIQSRTSIHSLYQFTTRRTREFHQPTLCPVIQTQPSTPTLDCPTYDLVLSHQHRRSIPSCPPSLTFPILRLAKSFEIQLNESNPSTKTPQKMASIPHETVEASNRDRIRRSSSENRERVKLSHGRGGAGLFSPSPSILFPLSFLQFLRILSAMTKRKQDIPGR
jgi:hypothetical protein